MKGGKAMDAKLNHSDLSALLAKSAGISLAKAELFTKTVFDLIIEGLEQDGIVKINGLGTFKLTDVANRSSVNVNTGEKIEIKGHKKLVFTPADSLKECVNQPFAMFEPVEVDETYSDDEEDNSEHVTEENVAVEDAKEEIADIAVDEQNVQEVVAEPEKEEEKVEEIFEKEIEQQPEQLVVQPKRREPVMVHVPKKEKKTFAVPEKKKKRSYKWLYITLFALLLVSVAAVWYFTCFAVKEAPVAEQPVAVETTSQQPQKVYTADAVTGATVDATSGATPQEKELVTKEETLDVLVKETSEPEEYKFVITKELASLDLKDITLADTALYDIVDTWAEHKVVAHETLTRISLKYYGDKKLWPYIVKYNSMTRPDRLSKGMKILIPKLKPRD